MNKVFLSLFALFLFLILSPNEINAHPKVNIEMDGVIFKTRIEPVIKNGRVLINVEDFKKIIHDVEEISLQKDKIFLDFSKSIKNNRFVLTPRFVLIGDERKLNLNSIDVSYQKYAKGIMLPIRSIFESLGHKVDWESDTYSVIVHSKKGSENVNSDNLVEGNINNYSDDEFEIFTSTNRIRNKFERKSLILDDKLSNAAELKAKDMQELNYFSHISPTYGNPEEMLKGQGVLYNKIGENIAIDYKQVSDVMKGWMESDNHRANLLADAYQRIGVSILVDETESQMHYVQIFSGN